MKKYYLGREVLVDYETLEDGWVWAQWPKGRMCKHWAKQLEVTPWGRT